MCFPPCCQPARRVLGCFSLRHGAAAVLILDALYGLCLVVVHAIVLGEHVAAPLARTAPSREGGEGFPPREALQTGPPALSQRRLRQLEPTPPGQRPLEEEEEERIKEKEISAVHSADCIFQIVELDLGWQDGFLPTKKRASVICGLLFGLMTVLFSGCMFNAVLGGHAGVFGEYLPTATRWFVAFMHLEIILFVALVFCKSSKLCDLQERSFPLLHMECSVLWFTYMERVSLWIVAASLCTWVFSSFAFVVTFGDAALDKPEYGFEMDGIALDKPEYGYEMEDIYEMGYSKPPNPAYMDGPPLGPLPELHMPSMQSMRGGKPPPPQLSEHGFSRHFPTAESHHSHHSVASRHSVGSHHGQRSSWRRPPPARSSPPARAGARVPPMQHASYDSDAPTGRQWPLALPHPARRGGPPNAQHYGPGGGGGGGGRQPMRTSYNIPRASSSMASSTTDTSHGETHALIKPPVAVF